MGKLRELFAKLKEVKHIEIVVGCALVAVVLVIYFSCVAVKDKNTSDAYSDLSGVDYCTAMQVRLEKTVSQIQGVGEASVVINWDRSASASLLGSGGENPKATGVIVVCAGGADPKVKVDVIFAVSTLLDISIDKINVYPKSK